MKARAVGADPGNTTIANTAIGAGVFEEMHGSLIALDRNDPLRAVLLNTADLVLEASSPSRYSCEVLF